MKDGWIRVSRSRPCPICDHADWCMVARDGSACICARIESSKRAGEAGYLHVLKDRPRTWTPPPMRISTAPVADRSSLARSLAAAGEKIGATARLSKLIGVSAESLRRFGLGYILFESAWTWPLYAVDGTTCIGIARRFQSGEKKIMPGHRAGLYCPGDLPCDLSGATLLICEGGSDAATALDLGYWSVGRFSCTHGAGYLSRLIQDRHPREVVIVADADQYGARGAEALAVALIAYVPILKLITPPEPHKDLRAWKQAGATADDLSALINSTPPRRLAVRGVA